MGKPLPTDLVRELRKRYDAGYRVSELAEQFNLHYDTVDRCVKGQTHRRVQPVESPLMPEAARRPRPTANDADAPPEGLRGSFRRMAETAVRGGS